ncbi:MAG TPA: fructose 1,6-bisphosphatase [Thermodesulfobacteriota bacterium]|nr:fructose 1,6-bisphosphatase [Thermodesulfobacteriota bacterium]
MSGRPKLTLSVIKIDPGGFVGHVSTHPDVVDAAKERLFSAKEKGRITDFHVLRCGNDIDLVVSHYAGLLSDDIKELATGTFNECIEVARELKLSAPEVRETGGPEAGKDGPALAEIGFVERESEPVVVFMSNKTTRGAWNLPIYKIFADPFNTVGLVLDPEMFEGFSFKVLDVKDGTEVMLSTPADIYAILTLVGISSRYVISSVVRNSDGEAAAAVCTSRLAPGGQVALSGDNPLAVMRCQAGLPAVGEVMESFVLPHLVEGWMGGVHSGPLMPVPFYEANPTRFDGPPRLIGAGFQVSNGRLIGPHDMFDDPSFDESRRLANTITEYMRRHGPFQPHLLSHTERGHRTLPIVINRLKQRFGR